MRSPSSPAPDKGQRRARSTVDSLFHWRSLSTSDLPPASHQQSLTTTGTLTTPSDNPLVVVRSKFFSPRAEILRVFVKPRHSRRHSCGPALGCPVLVSPMLVKAAARRASCLVPRLAPVLSSIKSPRAYSTSSGDPSEAHWCDNLLTVTGPRADIAAFADANVATSPSFLPQRTPFGGLAFLASAPGPLSFQPLLPTSESGILEHDRCEEAWGCTTDARHVQMLPGQPRIKVRKSVRYEFWLCVRFCGPRMRLGPGGCVTTRQRVTNRSGTSRADRHFRVSSWVAFLGGATLCVRVFL